jgi:hypothetical protein
MSTSKVLASIASGLLLMSAAHCAMHNGGEESPEDVDTDSDGISVGTPCTSNLDCGNKFCEFEPSACGGAGTCQKRPAQCVIQLDEYEVCGCDGQTYPYVCAASQAGTSIAHRGPCVPPDAEACQKNSDCQKGQFCNRDGCVAVGFCQDVPTYCGGQGTYQTYGCDCTVYPSICHAHAQKKSVTVHPHACE